MLPNFNPYPAEVLQAIKDSGRRIRVKEDLADKLKLYADNLGTERKSSDTRDDETRLVNIGSGIAPEACLFETGFFEEFAPPAKDAKKSLSYVQRKIDARCILNGRLSDVKSVSWNKPRTFPCWFLEFRPAQSLKASCSLNDDIILYAITNVGEKKNLVVDSRALAVIDAKSLLADWDDAFSSIDSRFNLGQQTLVFGKSALDRAVEKGYAINLF
jgi:hypothetical protein